MKKIINHEHYLYVNSISIEDLTQEIENLKKILY